MRTSLLLIILSPGAALASLRVLLLFIKSRSNTFSFKGASAIGASAIEASAIGASAIEASAIGASAIGSGGVT